MHSALHKPCVKRKGAELPASDTERDAPQSGKSLLYVSCVWKEQETDTEPQERRTRQRAIPPCFIGEDKKRSTKSYF